MATNNRIDRRIVAAVALGLTLAGWLAAGARPADARTPPAGARQAVVTVKGMQCPFCAYGIKKHLAKIPGVRKVDVDLAKNQATVQFAPDARPTDEQIQRAVKDAGFTPGKIEWRTVETGQTSGAEGPWRSGASS